MSNQTAALVIAALMATSTAYSGADLKKQRERIEELFVWKVSDSLGLNPAEEAQLEKVIKVNSQLRRKLTANLDQILQTKKVGKKVNDRYEKILRQLSVIGTQELKSLRKILGEDRLTRYLKLKHSLRNQLKNLVAGPSKKMSGPLTAKKPKIVEE